MRSTLLMLAVVLTACPPDRLSAWQCPDGAPPPCRSTMSGRAPNMPLMDNVWLVLPFDNTARAADAELIRQASISQLTGEMSRWGGIRTISDDRVADLIQQLPPAQRERPGLEAALLLARRVGAGRVVLGGYLAAGGRANITAKVYETRTGQELRTVRESLQGYASAAALDSLGASFGRLARGVLDMPAGSGAVGAGPGTQSIEAYRAYVSGMDALNRIQIDSARAAFARAVQLDSNFALAHLQYTRVSMNEASSRSHLATAQRLSTSLPPRSRALVDGLVAQQSGDRPALCRASSQLLGADSSDAEGWALEAWCHRNLSVVVDGGRPRLAGDVNRAMRAAERAYALAPNALASIQAMNTALGIGAFMQCVPPATATCPPENNYRVAFIPSGDSQIVIVKPWPEVKRAPPDLTPAAIEGQVSRLRREETIIQRLLAINPESGILHHALAITAQAAGDLSLAREHFGKGATSAFDTFAISRSQYLPARLELALALEDSAGIRLYSDSCFTRAPNGFGQYRSMLGRLSETGDTSANGRSLTMWRSILVGVLPPGFDILEQGIASVLTGPQHDDFLQLTTLAGFHMRHSGPALDTAAAHPLKRYMAWFARGDTARARAALAEFDRELLARHPNTPDDGGWLFGAEAHLDLRDSLVAFQRMQEFGRRWGTSIPGAYILETRYFQSTTPRLWGRTWLLYGDLAMARGQSAEARRAYRMVVALWGGGEPVVQPMVTRARAALAQLGS